MDIFDNENQASVAYAAARQRIRDYREREGFDRDDNQPTLGLLAEVLFSMHRTALKVEPYVNQSHPSGTVAAKEISQWLFQEPNPVFSEPVEKAAEEILQVQDRLGVAEGLLPILQRLFDAGRETGADQEALAFRGSTAEEAKNPQYDPRAEILGQVHASAQRMGLDPGHMRARAERGLNRGTPQAVRQCRYCSGAIYPDMTHDCIPAAYPLGRSFGDRGR